MCKVMACTNCGEVKPHRAHGMCMNCYRYWHTHKKMRPLDKDELKRRRKITHCVNCGELRQGRSGRRGMCSKCYEYWRWSDGIMRPMRLIDPSSVASSPLCSNCRVNMVRHGSLCQKCANYQYDNGKKRPRRLWAESCSNCDRPFNGFHPRSGLCIKCRRYQYKYGKPRPAYLWDKGEHGWCDCGQPATRTVDVRIYRKIEKMPVCESCYAEEMRQQKWYGGATQNQEGVNQQHSTR